MKLKNLFFGIALLVACSVSAQKDKVQFGIKVGINRSAGIVNDAHEIRFKTGYHVGGFMDYALNRKFGLQVGVLLSEKGGKYVGLNSGDYVGGIPDYKHKLNALYASVPISVFYKWNLAGKWKLNFGVGTYFAYGISGKSRIDITGVYSDGTNFREWDTFIDDQEYADGPSLKRFDFGMLLNCEIEYNKIFLGVGLEQSFVNGLSRSVQDLKLYNFNIPISIGYRF